MSFLTKQYRRNHAWIGAALSLSIGLVLTPILGASCAVGFYTVREVVQFGTKGHEFTLEVLWKHFLDVLAAAVGAVPVAVILWLVQTYVN